MTTSGIGRRESFFGGWRLAAASQLGFVGLVLLVCLVLPRDGQGVLLVPLTREARVLPHIRNDSGGTALLGRGPLPGSFVVRATGSLPLWAMLRDGVVPVAVPQLLCGPAGWSASAAGSAILQARGSHG